MNEKEVQFWIQTLALAAVAFGVVVAIVRSQFEFPDRLDGIRQFVQVWDAKLESGRISLIENARFTFVLDDRPVALEFSGAEGDSWPTHTHFTAPLRGISLRLELRPQWLHTAWGKLLKVEDIQLNSSYFDEAFLIHGSSPQQVRDFLTPPVQEAIWKLARCSRYSRFDLRLLIHSGQLLITKDDRLETEKELTQFVGSCRELLLQIQELDPDINFIKQAAPRLSNTTECQVCGDPLQEKNCLLYEVPDTPPPRLLAVLWIVCRVWLRAEAVCEVSGLSVRSEPRGMSCSESICRSCSAC